MTVTAKFYRKLAELKLEWHDVRARKLWLEDEIDRYENVAELVSKGTDPIIALLSVDSYHREIPVDMVEIMKLRAELA